MRGGCFPRLRRREKKTFPSFGEQHKNQVGRKKLIATRMPSFMQFANRRTVQEIKDKWNNRRVYYVNFVHVNFDGLLSNPENPVKCMRARVCNLVHSRS